MPRLPRKHKKSNTQGSLIRLESLDEPMPSRPSSSLYSLRNLSMNNLLSSKKVDRSPSPELLSPICTASYYASRTSFYPADDNSQHIQIPNHPYARPVSSQAPLHRPNSILIDPPTLATIHHATPSPRRFARPSLLPAASIRSSSNSFIPTFSTPSSSAESSPTQQERSPISATSEESIFTPPDTPEVQYDKQETGADDWFTDDVWRVEVLQAERRGFVKGRKGSIATM